MAAAQRNLAWIVLVGLLLAVSGCDDEDEVRKPIPMLEVEVLAEPGVFMLDNQRMDFEHLKAELRRVADDSRRPITNTCRAYVRMYVRKGASNEVAEDLVSFCHGIGLDQIENRGSGN
jgi:hypothetical protein